MNTAALFEFIKERHAIYERRAKGLPWPWTADPILLQYRFCNVYRNLDKETLLIHNHWLRPYAQHEDVWFAMAVARLVNWWPTLAELGDPLPWKPARFVDRLDKRRAAGQKVFTGAYMVRADAVIGGTKAAYLAEYVLTPLWQDRKSIRPRAGDTLDAFHKRLQHYRDMGSFMAAQVVADVKYAGGPLAEAADWYPWAASGPGSRRGLNRVLGRPVQQNWKESEWRAYFADLYYDITPLIKVAKLPRLSGQNLQNCLCEFDKYERVRLGEGAPRSKYFPPSTSEGVTS